MIYISKSFAAELGIKNIDKVQFANDEENTKDWFICKTDSEQGFLSSTTKAVFAL